MRSDPRAAIPQGAVFRRFLLRLDSVHPRPDPWGTRQASHVTGHRYKINDARTRLTRHLQPIINSSMLGISGKPISSVSDE